MHQNDQRLQRPCSCEKDFTTLSYVIVDHVRVRNIFHFSAYHSFIFFPQFFLLENFRKSESNARRLPYPRVVLPPKSWARPQSQGEIVVTIHIKTVYIYIDIHWQKTVNLSQLRRVCWKLWYVLILAASKCELGTRSKTWQVSSTEAWNSCSFSATTKCLTTNCWLEVSVSRRTRVKTKDGSMSRAVTLMWNPVWVIRLSIEVIQKRKKTVQIFKRMPYSKN